MSVAIVIYIETLFRTYLVDLCFKVYLLKLCVSNLVCVIWCLLFIFAPDLYLVGPLVARDGAAPALLEYYAAAVSWSVDSL